MFTLLPVGILFGERRGRLPRESSADTSIVMKGLLTTLLCFLIQGAYGGNYNYSEAIHKSILFYEAQRSGDLPANNRISWRKDSALGDKGDNDEDLTGGWYDAGDFVKFNFPMAFSVTTLAWGVLEFEKGYVKAGEYERVLDSIKWPLDYLLKCHVSPCELYGQVGDGHVDHAFWGRPEDMTMKRPAFKLTKDKPGSDLAAETAAAMAAGYLVFKDKDPEYAERLLYHAKQIYDFAYNYRGKYSDSITNVQSFYKSWSGYNDELAWGGMWLYWATGDCIYLNKAKEFSSSDAGEFSWDSKMPGAHMLLYKLTGDKFYERKIERFAKRWMEEIKRTPKGLVWNSQWGVLRYSANAAMIVLVGAKYGIRTEDGRKWAKSQIDYMLGDGGRSYVVGFGTNPPVRPHHSSSSCPLKPASCGWNEYSSPAPNPHVLYGALVGGPDANDNYKDVRSDYVKNEVACDYNAGFQSALAGLITAAIDSKINKPGSVDVNAVCGTTLSDVLTCKVSSRITASPTDVPKKTSTERTAAERTTPQTTQSAGHTRPGAHTGNYNYSEVIHKSILFYEAQRSGDLPADNRISWRKDSALGDKGDNDEDLTGGWYDAGDFVKFNFPMAFSVTTLAWGVLEFKKGYAKAGEYERVLDSIKWPLDYLLKCHVSPCELYGQVGDGHVDHAFWGRPEDMTMKRPAFKLTKDKPGSDLAAETAAAMAAGYIVFKDKDPVYAEILLYHAKQIYDFAYTYRGKYSDSITNAQSFYRSWSGYNDELAWGGMWLYWATGDCIYLNKAKEFSSSDAGEFSWDSKLPGAHMLLYKLSGDKVYKEKVEQFANRWMEVIQRTPKGLVWNSQWGVLRYSANAAMIVLVGAKYGIRTTDGRKWAKSQIDYMLGDGGRSYVVGFGTNPPVRPHHSSSSCPPKPASCGWNEFNSPLPNPHVLYGALVGGPDANDNYKDVRSDYIKNEVACDYNAGFQSVLAGLITAAIDSKTNKPGSVNANTVCSSTLSDVFNCKVSSRITTSTTDVPKKTSGITRRSTVAASTTPQTTPSSATQFTTISTVQTTKESPKRPKKYNYRSALKKSILFYEAQRSGKLVNNRISWRGDSALSDKGNNSEDLTGGYYDGFGFVKNTFTTAYTMTMLSWSMIDFQQAYRTTYKEALAGVKWGLDYLLKCYDGNKQLYAFVGDPGLEWTAWNRPEDMKVARPAFKVTDSKPGTDVMAETAAAMAAGAIVFKNTNAQYSKILLDKAVKLYEFALTSKKGIYNNAVSKAYNYWSSGYKDELVWAAIWLYKATGDKKYLENAEDGYKGLRSPKDVDSFSWDKKDAAIYVLLFQITPKEQYVDAIMTYLRRWFQGGQIRYTEKGLAFYRSPGALKYAANTAAIAIEAAKSGITSVNDVNTLDWAKSQIGYILGDTERSFVVGFGKNSPRKPHHKGSSCPKKLKNACGWKYFNSVKKNPNKLVGALVSGPQADDSYTDKRDQNNNQVSIDANAGFQMALAGLIG